MPVVPGPQPVPPGLTVTSSGLINSALRLIGSLSAGEIPDPQESIDALAILNQMVDSWNTERYLIFVVASTLFTLTTLKQTYTLGTGGDFNIPRPPKVVSVSVISNQAPQALELPLQMLNTEQWQDIPVKNVSSALSQMVYNDNAFPLINLNFWPIMSILQNQYNVYYWQLLTFFTDLGKTQYTFPPGYIKALRYNLAVDLSAEFNGDPEKMPAIIAIAREAKAKIKSINIRPELMTCDPAILTDGTHQIYNWLTDTFVGQ